MAQATRGDKSNRSEKSPAAKQPAISPVEQAALQAGGYELRYPPNEKLPAIVVDNFPNLGRLTALRFLEWVAVNPEGVVALPTGKTPEYFIKYVTHYLANWSRKEIRTELEEHGLKLERKPVLAGLRFVQLDEFYPIDTRQHNSFYYYVNKFYIKGFGLDPRRALLIDPTRIGLPQGMAITDMFPEMTVDLSLRTRKAQTLQEKRQQKVIVEVDQFCTEYEHRIREMGGIGFFMGGIGPDGHIAFNIRGSDFFSTTRLIEPNYETRAAAATDLGGMEVARNKLVITIGLRTITYNKNAVAIIIAAGEAKADIVARTIHSEPRNEYPGSALGVLPNARFYLTRGSANRLSDRVFVDFTREEQVPAERINRIVMDLSLQTGKPIQQLGREDFLNDRFGAELIKKTKSTYQALKDQTHQAVLDNLKRGNQKIERQELSAHRAPPRRHHPGLSAVRDQRGAAQQHAAPFRVPHLRFQRGDQQLHARGHQRSAVSLGAWRVRRVAGPGLLRSGQHRRPAVGRFVLSRGRGTAARGEEAVGHLAAHAAQHVRDLRRGQC
jgi:glucosamine-6-phosphate deaminase